VEAPRQDELMVPGKNSKFNLRLSLEAQSAKQIKLGKGLILLRLTKINADIRSYAVTIVPGLLISIIHAKLLFGRLKKWSKE
jgi:accessory gene regulator protein AgrB